MVPGILQYRHAASTVAPDERPGAGNISLPAIGQPNNVCGPARCAAIGLIAMPIDIAV